MKTETNSGDAQLTRLLSSGSEEAFAVIYAACSGPVYRFALQMTGDANSAEEITQDTLLRLLSNPTAYQPARGPMLAWLLGIARNLSRRALGDTHNTELLDEGCDYEIPPDRDFLGELTRKELVTAVRQAVASLPPAAREVIVLCELQELPYREAALVLDCPVGTVRSRLHRARALLMSKLQAWCIA